MVDENDDDLGKVMTKRPMMMMMELDGRGGEMMS